MAQLERLQTRTEENNEELLIDLLESAKGVILARRFPFGDYPDELPKRYEDLQVRIAAELYAKMGAEGQISHSENGISRTWAAANVSQELLNEIVPLCGGLA